MRGRSRKGRVAPIWWKRPRARPSTVRASGASSSGERPRIQGKAAKRKSAKRGSVVPPIDQRRGHLHLGRGKLGGEGVLLEDLRIRPAPGAVELQHQLLLPDPHLVHAVFVGVQGKQAPVRAQIERGTGIQHHLRCQTCERLPVRGALLSIIKPL